MQKSLSLIYLSILSLTVTALTFLYGQWRSHDSEWVQTCDSNDAETLLARGCKIQLQTATLVDLELVPGLSSSMAESLLASRHQFIERCSRLPPAISYLALLHLRGVKERKAIEIAQYLALC